MNAPLFDTKKPSTVRCFVLSGDDTASLEHARSAIIAAVASSGPPLTTERFDPSVEPFSAFVQRLLSPSLFQETRLFLVRHAQDLAVDDFADLAAALDEGLPDAFLLIEIDGGKKETSSAIKKLGLDKRCSGGKPLCWHGEFSAPPSYKIAEWLVDRTPGLVGRRISLRDAEYFADRVGHDLGSLHSELQKIDLHLPPDAPVTRAAIDEVTGALREMDAFELAAALGRRDFLLALRIIDGLFSATGSIGGIGSVLGRHFWALFRINAFFTAHPDLKRRWAVVKGRRCAEQTEIGLAIGKAAGLLGDGQENRLYPMVIKSGIADQASSFTGRELRSVLAWLLEFDTGVKTGRIEASKHALQLLCYRIVRSNDRSDEVIAA